MVNLLLGNLWQMFSGVCLSEQQFLKKLRKKIDAISTFGLRPTVFLHLKKKRYAGNQIYKQVDVRTAAWNQEIVLADLFKR